MTLSRTERKDATTFRFLVSAPLALVIRRRCKSHTLKIDPASNITDAVMWDVNNFKEASDCSDAPSFFRSWM